MVSRIEEEEKAQWDRWLATTEELEKAWARIGSLEEDLEKAKANAVREVLTGPTISEPVAPVNLQTSTELVASTETDSNNA